MVERKRVLITVKTYPLPSEKYQELVCTAGVLEDGSFVRLYPIDFRYRPPYQWYRKYQWIELDVEKNVKDARKESYRPLLDSIRLIGPALGTGERWAARRAIVLSRGATTMEELRDLQVADGTSLGIVRPRVVTDFLAEPTDIDWKPEWRALFMQMTLFAEAERKRLDKIPYRFSYRFECDDPRCKGHKMMIEDWEVGALYLNVRPQCSTDEQAIAQVRQKFFDQMCGPDIDTHFFVGTIARYPKSWVILGVFWPKKET